MNFSADEYISGGEIAVDGASFTNTINRLILYKMSRKTGVQKTLTVGALRPQSDSSVVTALAFTDNNQLKLFGVDSWSTNGLLTGFKLLMLDRTIYDTAKADVTAKKVALDDAQRAKIQTEMEYNNE